MSPDKEPLKALSLFRVNEKGGVFFGQNMVALNEGTIRLGDPIEVLETKPKEQYLVTELSPEPVDKADEDSASPEPALVTIDFNGQMFDGNNQTSVLQQVEEAGLWINSSCRAGLCGACMVTLESGEVAQEWSSALSDDMRQQGKILACCSVPLTDIEIKD